MTEETKPPVSEHFEQVMKSYEQTLRSGLIIREETGKRLAGKVRGIVRSFPKDALFKCPNHIRNQ